MNLVEVELEQKPFYHGTLPREKAESLIRGRIDGTFLLRKSRRGDLTFVISVAFQGECLHYSISPTHQQDGQTVYSINKGTPYATPLKVCEHYMTVRGGLRVKLEWPIAKMQLDDSNGSAYVTEVEWYHNEITREEDSRRLNQAYRMHHVEGTFLVRKKDRDNYVLSLINTDRIHRYMIHQNPAGQCWIVGKDKNFENLQGLVAFHMQNPPQITGIHSQLTIPCSKAFSKTSGSTTFPVSVTKASAKMKTSVLSLASELKRLLPGDGMDIQWCSDDRNSQGTAEEQPPNNETPVLYTSGSRKWLDQYRNISQGMPDECPGYKGIYQNLMPGGVALDLFVNESDISVHEQLGKGHFGAVCLGRCKINGEKVPCAIKFLKGEDVMSNKKELLAEASLMQQLDHPNIMRLIAVCETNSNLMLLLELAPLGTFRGFLRAKGENGFSELKILNIMQQVAHGMAYLASKNIVHRDLAARNILLVSENFAKVSDFGMSKVLMETENYYRSSRPGSWPLRWYSPEALFYYKFTTKCDVWGYGVTLWEAFSYGERPYQGMKAHEILQMLEQQERLACPKFCPSEVYELMLLCWTYDADERPEFYQVADHIDKIASKFPNPC